MLPTPEEKRAALEEVLQTATFVRAAQLQSFLRLICEMEIAGRAAEINEHLIGVEALGRSNDYSPAHDSVVRRRAVDLREKLDEVYASDLSASRLRVELPKGRYVPHFVRAEPTPVPPLHTALAPGADASARARRAPTRSLVIAFGAGAAFASAVFVALGYGRTRGAAQDDVSAGVSYEAEAPTNVLNGTATVELCEGCSGRHRVRRIGNLPSNHIVVRGVRVSQRGPYEVALHYLLSGERTFHLSVNAGPAFSVPVLGTSWTVPARATVWLPLEAGENTVKVYNDTEYAPDLDRLVVRTRTTPE